MICPLTNIDCTQYKEPLCLKTNTHVRIGMLTSDFLYCPNGYDKTPSIHEGYDYE